MLHVVLLQPASIMRSTFALDALLVAGTGHGQVLHSQVHATPSSLYTQSVTAVWASNRKAQARLHARSAGLLLSISCGPPPVAVICCPPPVAVICCPAVPQCIAAQAQQPSTSFAGPPTVEVNCPACAVLAQ
ncbi:TPA: hypothetical protein ACH3X3_008503 [Trebouxia sp. C0006]